MEEAIRKALNSPDSEILRDNSLKEIYKKEIRSRSVEELIIHIVELRGFLHHHTLKNKQIWNPEKQNEFKVDALFLLHVCFNIAMETFTKVALSKEAKGTYESIKFQVKE